MAPLTWGFSGLSGRRVRRNGVLPIIVVSITKKYRDGSTYPVRGWPRRGWGLTLSVPALPAELDGIGETVVLLYQGERGRPCTPHAITRDDPIQHHS